MARILKRPMFNRGGSTNNGIMTGLVDRKGYNAAGMVTDIQETLPGLEEIIRDYTPKVKLPLAPVEVPSTTKLPLLVGLLVLLVGYKTCSIPEESLRVNFT